jgi:membrane-bound lytic murein transglycosylase B
MPYHLSGRTVVNTLGAAFFVIVLAHAGPAVARSHDYPARPAVQKFIDKMVANHGFNRATLEALFAGARHRQSIIDSMNRPAEALPWYRYRHIFLTRQRTAGGIAFRHEHRAALDRAEKVYGVPPAIVTAIIGVESRYGSNKGKYRVIDALATLSFDYPPRAGFFRKELAQYLLLSREQQFNPAKMTGSYAGAMGAPQFISSSYRKYAVDLRRRQEQPVGQLARHHRQHRQLLCEKRLAA